MSKDPYKTHEGGAGVADIAAVAAGATTAFANPMGSVQNAQAAYHNHKFMKLRHEGNKQAMANAPAGEERRRQWSSPEMMATLENDLPMDKVGRLIDDKRPMRASDQFPDTGFTGKHGLSKSEAGALMHKFETGNTTARKTETKKDEEKKDEKKKKNKWFH